MTSSLRSDLGASPLLFFFLSKATMLVLLNSIEKLAKRKGASMAQVALAWVLSKPGVTTPIVGTTSLANIEDLLGALDVVITDEDVKFVEEAYGPLPIAGNV